MTLASPFQWSVVRRWSVWALLVAAVLAGPVALRGQEEAGPGTSGRRPVVTRAQLQQSLEAAGALLAKGFQPKRTIMFAFGHDEEVGGTNGNAKIAALLAERKIELEFVNDEGGMISVPS